MWSSEVHLTAPSSQMYVWMDVAVVVLVVSRQAGSGPSRYWSETVILGSYNLVPTKPGLNQTINCVFGPNLLKPGKTG